MGQAHLPQSHIMGRGFASFRTDKTDTLKDSI